MAEEKKVQKPSALFLLGSLKGTKPSSNSRKLAQMLVPLFQKYGISAKEIHLASKDIKPGIKTDQGDDFKAIFEEINKANIVIFVTPIWWGEQSSLIQRVIERLDETDSKHAKGEPHPFLGKVFGVVVSGAEDGSQSIISRLNGWASHLGFVIPPFNSVSHLGDPEEVAKDKKKQKAVEVTAANLIIAAVHGANVKWAS